MKAEHIYAAILAIIVLLAGLYMIASSPKTADASPPTFVRVSTTAGTGAFASSSPTYMTAGTATTSLTYDAYAAQGTGEVNGQMTFTANIQTTASSSVGTTYCRVIELSHDGTDWYPFSATTTATTNVGLNPHCWTSASSTLDLSAGITARSGTSIQVPILDRYIRVLFYLPSGSQNGAIWAESIGMKQRI